MRPDEFFEQLRLCPDNWYIWKDLSYPKGALRTRERKGYRSVDPICAVYRHNYGKDDLNTFEAAEFLGLSAEFILQIVNLSDGEPAINEKDKRIRSKLWRCTVEKQ